MKMILMITIPTLWLLSVICSHEAEGLPKEMTAAPSSLPDLLPPSTPASHPSHILAKVEKEEEEGAFLQLVCGGEASKEVPNVYTTPPLSSSSSSSSDNPSLVSDDTVLFHTSPSHLHSSPSLHLLPAQLHMPSSLLYLSKLHSISPHLSPHLYRPPAYLPLSPFPFLPSPSNEAEGEATRRKRGAKGTKRGKIKGDGKRTETWEKGDRKRTAEKKAKIDANKEQQIAHNEKEEHLRENKSREVEKTMEKRDNEEKKSTKSSKNKEDDTNFENRHGKKTKNEKTITEREKVYKRREQASDKEEKREKGRKNGQKVAKAERTKKNRPRDEKGDKQREEKDERKSVKRRRDRKEEHSKTKDSTKKTCKTKSDEETDKNKSSKEEDNEQEKGKLSEKVNKENTRISKEGNYKKPKVRQGKDHKDTEEKTRKEVKGKEREKRKRIKEEYDISKKRAQDKDDEKTRLKYEKNRKDTQKTKEENKGYKDYDKKDKTAKSVTKRKQGKHGTEKERKRESEKKSRRQKDTDDDKKKDKDTTTDKKEKEGEKTKYTKSSKRNLEKEKAHKEKDERKGIRYKGKDSKSHSKCKESRRREDKNNRDKSYQKVEEEKKIYKTRQTKRRKDERKENKGIDEDCNRKEEERKDKLKENKRRTKSKTRIDTIEEKMMEKSDGRKDKEEDKETKNKWRRISKNGKDDGKRKKGIDDDRKNDKEGRQEKKYTGRKSVKARKGGKNEKDGRDEGKKNVEEKRNDRKKEYKEKQDTRKRQRGRTKPAITGAGRNSQNFTPTRSTTTTTTHSPTQYTHSHMHQLTQPSPTTQSPTSAPQPTHSSTLHPSPSYQSSTLTSPQTTLEPSHTTSQDTHPTPQPTQSTYFSPQPTLFTVQPSHSTSQRPHLSTSDTTFSSFSSPPPSSVPSSSATSPPSTSSSFSAQGPLQHRSNHTWRVDYLDPSLSFAIDGASLQLKAKEGYADWLIANTRFTLHSPSSPASSTSSSFPVTVYHSRRHSDSTSLLPPSSPATITTTSLSSDSSSPPAPSSPAPALAVLQCSPQNSPPKVVLLAKECGKRRGDEVFPSDAVVLCPDPTSLLLQPQHPTDQREEETQPAPSEQTDLHTTTSQPELTSPSPPSISVKVPHEDTQREDFFNMSTTTGISQESVNTTFSSPASTTTDSTSIEITVAETSGDEDDKKEDAKSASDNQDDIKAAESDEEVGKVEGKEERTVKTEEQQITEEEDENGEENESFTEDSLYEETDKRTDAVGVFRHGAMRISGGLRRASRDLGLSHYPHSESAPQLRYTPIEQTVSPGAPVSLKCSAVGSPLPVITWTRDQQPFPPSHRTSVGSFRTALGQVVSHVNLSDVTVREGGVYTCTAHNAHGSQSHSARLNVYGPPFVRAMPNVTAVAGEDVYLWCPAGGFPAPAISWRRDGRALPSSIRQDVMSNGTLVVRAASHEDAGRYSCVVTGRQGQTAASHTFLHVLKPPEIDTFTFRQGLEEGRRTQLSCMVTGGDLPITINWLKDGRHLQHDPDLESKQVSDFSMVLVFKRLQEHHSGAYTCEAANAAAAINHTAILKVKVSPRWVVEPGGGTALVGSTVVLDCSARGYPQPVITWMKAPGKSKRDFQPLVVDGLRSSQASNGSLILQDAKTTDAGWYMCRAGNSVGKPISKAVQLTVHAPARVVTEGGRVTGHAGQMVTVACEATGDDPLTLTWLRHHAPISPGHRASITESEGGGLVRAVLEMRSVTSADAGPYTCRASNPHGDHSQVFDVAIIEPPTPPSNIGVSEVTSRSAVVTWSLPQPAAVTIQYKAEGEMWAKQGRNVSVGQWTASHVLTGLSPHLTYAVRLMAHNDLGVSQPSPIQLFTTTEEAPSGAPRDVRVAASGPRSLLVTWRSPDPRLTHGALRGYTLALRRQNLQGHFTFITRPVTDLGGVEQYEVRGLVPASLYEVAVRAFTRAGPGPLSSPRIVDSTSHDAPSCAPSGVSCRGSGRGGVRVWWSPPPSSCVHAPVSGYSIVATPTRHIQSSSSDGNSWEVNTTNLEKNLDALPSATNISVRVKAYNEIGFSPPSRPVFCVTEDDVPGPPEGLRAVVTGPTTILVTWSPPRPHTGTILHYTLYSSKDDQVVMRDVVGAGGSEATWRELSGLTTASRVQVWVTATTVAGEGNPSTRITAIPNPKPSYIPVAVGGGQLWQVGVGAGVTLGCRGLGSPTPTTSWTRGGVTVASGQLTQLLPGGDLHLTAVRESDNYTCWARSSGGVDSLTHQVVVLTPPAAPSLSLSHATYNALNLTITPAHDGGAPILGYTVHHRGRAGEWVEVEVSPGASGAVVRGLPCGAPHHVYLTAWNSQGASAPSPVLVASTLGSPPGRPEPERLVEVNSTCVTLRLYAWPELGCPVTHWKVELGSEEEGVAWTPLHSRVTLDTTDLGVCDLASASWHLLRVTASSTAGDTTVVYRVATTDGTGGSIAAESIQEVLVAGGDGPGGWLDAHIVAGVVSALLLATAFIICVCVALRRRRYGGYRQGESVDTKGGGGEDDNARNSELTRAHLYSPTPTKKPRGSLASLKTQDDASDPYEICPYATFSVGSSDGTLEYGLSLHAMTPRDCLDHPSSTTHPHPSDRHAPAPPQSPAAYGHVGRQRSQSHYKETEIAYITRGGRGEYGSRPKSIPGAQLPPASNTAPAAVPTAAAAAQEQRQWSEEARKDTRGRQHRPRSRTRVDTPGGGRDSSTESNDASSPVQQGRHHHHYQHHHHHQQAGGGAGVRAGPHPLPPVRHAR